MAARDDGNTRRDIRSSVYGVFDSECGGGKQDRHEKMFSEQRIAAIDPKRMMVDLCNL